MTYTCTDFADSILEALGITVPDESADSPSDQADLALAEIERLKSAPKSVVVAVYTNKHDEQVRVFKNTAAAAKWKEKIAAEDWWDHFETDPPDDATKCADVYFELMGENENPEHFVIHDEEVEG